MTGSPDHRAVYHGVAGDVDAARGTSAGEGARIDRAVAGVAPGSAVLDLGRGSGAPIAQRLHDGGFRVTGVDFAPGMLALARARLPDAEWIEADMRALALGHRFAAIIAWDSLFHLPRSEPAPVRTGRHVRRAGQASGPRGAAFVHLWSGGG